MRKRRGLLLMALVPILWGSALGQDYKTFEVDLTEIRSTARMRFGPFRLAPQFRLTDVGYDNNVYFRTAQEGPVGDYVATLSPQVRTYLLAGHSLILSFTENPEYQFYSRQTTLRRFTNSIEPGARLRLFNRFVFSGSYHFQKHQRRAYSEFAGLVTDTDKGTKWAAFYETPRGSALGVTGAVDRYAYNDIILPDGTIVSSGSLNRKETTGAVELYYSVFAQSVFFITAGTTSYRFDDPAFQGRNSRSLQVLSGIRFPLLGRARGTLSLGYKKFTPDAKGRKSFSGLIADTNFDVRFGRIVLGLGLGRDNYFSYLADAFYFVQNTLDPRISFRLTRRFRLDYGLQYGWLRYSEPFPGIESGGASDGVVREDIIRTHTIGLTIFFFRRTGLQLSYNIYDRTSNVPDLGGKKNFVGLSLVQDF